MLQRQRWGGPKSRTTSVERQVSAVLCCTYASTLISSYVVWEQNVVCYERQLSVKSILKVNLGKDFCQLYSPKMRRRKWSFQNLIWRSNKDFLAGFTRIYFWSVSFFDQYSFFTSTFFALCYIYLIWYFFVWEQNVLPWKTTQCKVNFESQVCKRFLPAILTENWGGGNEVSIFLGEDQILILFWI